MTDLLPTQRPRYRAALAMAFADIPIVAAHHWRAAHRPAEARAAALEAGRMALELEAPLDALDAFELGLELPLPPPVAGPRRRSRRTDRLTASGWPRSRSWRPRRPPRPGARAVRRSTRRARLAALGERRDRFQHAVLEARLGRYRLAAGDGPGATAALRKAADVMPHEPSIERARVLALLAQERMIAAAFRDAEKVAREALDVAALVGDEAEPEAIHALTTLAVARGWGDQPEAAEPLLREAARPGAASSGSSTRRCVRAPT